MNYHACLVSACVALAFPSASLERVKLEFKHKEGSSTTLKTTSKVDQVLTVAGQNLETKANSTVTLTNTVGKRAADGRLGIEQRVDALTIQLALPMGGSLEFDSANPAPQSDNPRMQARIDAYKARVGSSHTIVLGKDNEVIAVEGTEKVLEKASPAAAEILRGEIKPDIAKRNAEQGFGIFPKEPVDIGDVWTRNSITRIGGGQMKFETRFEYLGTENKGGLNLDRIATSAFGVTYTMDPDAPTQLKITRSDLKIESSKGAILFDRSRGQTFESSSTTRIAGDLTMEINGMEIPGRLDLTLESSSAVQP
jgi:hypothetical protein